jgi:UDP-glucose 4-epimerase
VRALVTGGAGFIGSTLVDRLLAEAYVVDVVDDLSTGSLANLAVARAAAATGMLKIHHLDACMPEFASLVSMREPEVIYHLGWMPAGRIDSTALARGVQSVLMMLDAARATGAGKLVTTLPAVAMYGEVPARDLPVKESRAWAPIGAPGVIAHAVLELLRVHREQHGVEFTALAMTNVYGPRQRADGGVVAAFGAALAAGESPVLTGDGRQTRDFLYIDDAVDALVRTAGRGGGLVINIGTGSHTAIRDLWSLMAGPEAPVPRPGRPREPQDVARFAVSPTRARIHLSWAPWTELAVGLRSLRE